jgi:hypothetical protein
MAERADGCAPSGGLEFVCGAGQPEDLARVPGTGWVLVSGFAPGSGLKLLDTGTRTLVRWIGGRGADGAFDRDHYRHCPGPPDATQLDLQGISLRAESAGSFRLLASNHGGREAIEVFRVRASQGEPQGMPVVHWVGCLPLPRGMAANAVSSFPDGTVLATVLTVPGRTMADYVQGRDTGVVLEWRPGEVGFHEVPGTQLPGNNGLEADPDNRHYYVVSFGQHAIVGFERGAHARRIFESVAPGFMPDNIHWDGEQLIAAGMQYDEPACGGLRKVIAGVAEPMTCHRGYSVARFDPRTRRWQLLAYDTPNPRFNGVSTGLRVGGTLWLGSFQADRLASRPLPAGATR